MKKLIFPILFIIYSPFVFSQEVFVHTSNTGIYEFLDEMATMKIIDLNSAIKPYSRSYISEKLKEIIDERDKLNERQLSELNFYSKDYCINTGKEVHTDFYLSGKLLKKYRGEKRIDMFYYSDSLFQFRLNPILGMNIYTNDSGLLHHRWNGVDGWASIGKNWSFYANLRDNTVNMPMVEKTSLSQFIGRDNKSGTDNSEMRGGITYAWTWGSFGLKKDHFIWGNNYNGSNIFSGRTPSFAQIQLKMYPVKWFDFNYIHGWLVSEVVDSNSIYNFGGGAKRSDFYRKYVAANMYSLSPVKHLTVSFGNSVIYSKPTPEPSYLIPFFFFKSVEHTIAASNESNAQIFMDVSSRNIKKLHLFGTFFLDEINFGNALDPDKQSNWFGYKTGFRAWDLLVPNTWISAEFTRTNPMVYKHYYPTATFESNLYNLGHYLRDNAREYFVSAGCKPIRGLVTSFCFSVAEKGPDYPDIRDTMSPLGKHFLTEVEWKCTTISLKASYEVFHDAFFRFEINYTDITGKTEAIKKYTPDFFQGKQVTLVFGANLGF